MGLFDLFKKKTIPEGNKNEAPSTQISSAPDYMIKKVATEKLDHARKSIDTNSPPPLESFLETAVPSEGGLYPHEILMLDYAHVYTVSDNSFPGFWYYQYSVNDPQSVLSSLHERGFIEPGNLRSAIEKLKSSEIKDELKILNEKVSGKKEELVDRLLSSADHEALSAKYPNRFYQLTPKGEHELKKNQYVPYLHRHQYMSVWEMNRRIAQTHYPYRDILWGYFNEQSGIHFQNFDFGLYRNTRMYMYRFLMEENKPKTAFGLLCEVLSFDLSGLGNSEQFLFDWERNNAKAFLSVYESRVDSFFPYETTSLIIPPRVIEWFAELKTTLGFSNDIEFREAIIKELSEIHPPRRIFSDDECADILIAEINKDTYTLCTIYETAETREKARIKKYKSRI